MDSCLLVRVVCFCMYVCVSSSSLKKENADCEASAGAYSRSVSEL